MVLRGETLKPPAVFVVTRRFETRTPKKIEKDFFFLQEEKKYIFWRAFWRGVFCP
jgi:hypothetical protein